MKHFDYEKMFARLRSMGFNGDGAANGTFLPGSSQLAKQMEIPGHWSSHNQYTAEVKNSVDKLNTLFNGGRVSDTQLALGISHIQNVAREGLAAGKYAIDSLTGRLL